MEGFDTLDLNLDITSWGPLKATKNRDVLIDGAFAASNNDNIKGLCEVFLRGKKEDKAAEEAAVSFQVVEVKQQATKRITAQKKFQGQKNNYNRYQNKNWMEKNKGNRQTGKKQKMFENKRNIQNTLYRKEMKAKAKALKTLSCPIDSEWTQVGEMQCHSFNGLPKFKPGEPEVYARAGKIAEYRYDIDGLLSARPLKFTSFKDIPENKLSTQDITLDEIAIECIDTCKGTKIIASDIALATLMNISKAYYSWDLKVEKVDDMIFITKREKEEKEDFVWIDLEHVGENSITPPPAAIDDPKPALQLNTAMNLMKEGTKVLHSTQAIAINPESIEEFDHPHPSQEDEDQQDLPLHGYTYMKWPFGENRTLITRGQLHSFESISAGGDSEAKIKYTNIYAMNQWKFNKAEWKKVDVDKTAVLGGELTDNSNRVSKWALQSLFAGADNMKIMFVKRQKLSNASKHQILGTSTLSVNKFMNFISFKYEEAWSNVKYIVDYFEEKENGEYLLLRDPMKNLIKVFDVSQNDGEGEDDEEGEDADEGEGDENTGDDEKDQQDGEDE
ncbi:unnamed protein product [Moneuplotes crassus]|uniref:Eukaryotic translation initiation factor 3 subunit 7 n=1 Tax=Euplotes crassus TaxID=5936 RepID=A0AAD1UDH4_EUPCR|nr:unnamed protein product [Moneuplotes crassus]